VLAFENPQAAFQREEKSLRGPEMLRHFRAAR
jgi:hypothetical protein